MLCLLRLYHFPCLVLFFLTFQSNLPSSSSSTKQLCSPVEAAALIQFKNSFSIDNDSSLHCNYVGESYPKIDSWKEGTDCCSWDGVTCDNISGQLIGLDLSCSWLHGGISSNSSLFRLRHLQKLNLAFNNFSHSKMSSHFGGFASLLYLNLSRTYFAGRVPFQLSYLSKLVSLDLSCNYFEKNTLTVDTNTFGRLVSNLTSVRQLSLDGINMSSITSNALVNLSSSLRSLSLQYCDLRGNFPENIFHLPSLKSLCLRGNGNLNLKFPKVNRSSHLEFLDLSSVRFTAEGIDPIRSLQSLKYLYLSDYFSFYGGFPLSITNLSSLEHLDISMTNFIGGLPDSIGNLVSLKHLNLEGCNLSGPIPSSLTNLTQLEFLSLSGNQLESFIPDELHAFPNLIILDMFSNSFIGGLPDSIGNLVSLKQLNLQHCNISGPIPITLGNLSQLSDLDLSFNHFSGQIPSSLTNLRQLEDLTLYDNSLNGTLPSWLYTVSSLKSIDLSNNQFSGHIREFQSKSLEGIQIANNKLQGPIPSSISQLTNLTLLSLSSNNLSGVVHFDMFSQLQKLRALDLSQNALSFNSNRTSADFALPNLEDLFLSSCDLTEFPQFLKGSKVLNYLDLSHNRINGKIPKWMWDVEKDSLNYLNLSHNSLTEVEQLPWEAIGHLDLSSNLIHGDLPIPPFGATAILISNNSLSGEISSLLCNVTSLAILDLSYNNLTGLIPQCFENLSKSLSTLNLWRNNFSGIIPPTLFAKGCQLSYLNINDNQLEGPLPRSIKNCRGLEVIDLGNNKINDTFPHWMGSLPKLKALVLRSNQLHGSINGAKSSPSFLQTQIFDLSGNYFTGPLPLGYIKNFKAMINLTKEESAWSYMGMPTNISDSFYSYSIGLEIKGLETELTKIFTLLTTIDLSNNKFQGEIPAVVGELNSLKGLNLSHNNLNGCIPSSFGKMISLEWLDLSSNKLVGKIPESLADLTFLAFLNLSKNQLEGEIPGGKQFNTFGNGSYEGNKGLCGFPISKGCNNNEPPPSNLPGEDDGSKSNITFGWKVVLIGYCCGLVFGLAVGSVVFRTGKPKWFVTLVEDQQHKRRERSKRGNRCGVGRRI